MHVRRGPLRGRQPYSTPIAAVRAATIDLPESTVSDRSSPLDGLVAVLAVAETKGLEFDGVIVVEPAVIVSESERGLSDLYVALTRATRRLAVVHTEPLPKEMQGLRQPPATGDAVGAMEPAV